MYVKLVRCVGGLGSRDNSDLMDYHRSSCKASCLSPQCGTGSVKLQVWTLFSLLHHCGTWLCVILLSSPDSAEDVRLDPDSANPDLLISADEKRMRCGLERHDAPRCRQRFDGWWCVMSREGYTSGRHYWEVEVGVRDWRLGVAKASATRQGFHSLNTDTGYLTMRLERGSDLKALTVPPTLLSQNLMPKKVGVYLDYEQGQLSFYDVEKRSHLYTFNEKFTEELIPVFGTVEVLKDLVIRPADVREPCLCPGPCLWNWNVWQSCQYMVSPAVNLNPVMILNHKSLWEEALWKKKESLFCMPASVTLPSWRWFVF